MTEDLITDLSKISGLFVIARNSSFSYKGKQVKVRQVAEELGVRYVLEGSVRRADKQVRVNAQLIDATTGGHLWAERYDGSMADVFALQDRVTQKIVSALAVQLAARSETQTVQGGTKNAAAYDEFLQGWEHYKRRTPADFVKAVRFFERAVEMDPEYGRAYAALAIVYWKSWLWSVLTMSPAINVTWTRRLQIPLVYAPDRAKEYLQKAMNNPTPLAYQVASEMRWRERQYDEALAKAEGAIALNTNDPVGYVAMAEVLIYSGRAKEAVQFVEKAMRLDPHSAVNLYLLGLAHFSMGQMDKAATLFKRGVKRSPFSQWWNVPLAATYAHLGRDQDAQAALREWAGMIGLLDIVDLWPFRDVDIAEHFAVGVVKAGVCCDAGLERYLSDLRNRDP